MNGDMASVSPKSKRFWVALIAFLVIVFIIGGYVVWTNYLSPQAKSERETRLNYEKATKALNDYETAMKNDTYGGKTPEETLKLFIDALKKEDIELASKYFMLETNTKDPNYLTRKKWEDALMIVKKENRLSNVLAALGKIKMVNLSGTGAAFESLNESGIVDILVEMKFNEYSRVWKIESL